MSGRNMGLSQIAIGPLGLCLFVSLIGLSIAGGKNDDLRAQLQRDKVTADANLMNDREKDRDRIERLSAELTQQNVSLFEQLHELDTNFGRECKANATDGTIHCSAIVIGEQRQARFHCDTDGCEFDECGAVK